MSIDQIIGHATSRWMEGSGPAADVVLSSRIRLARNVAGFAFPPKCGSADAERVVARVEQAVAGLAGFSLYRLSDLAPLDRQVLVEKHLISPLLARNDVAAVALRDDEAVSIMILEEDHLRLQVLQPALQPGPAWKLANQVDDALQEKLTYAWDDRLGYLTTCPTNVGTGLRVSVMLHLPALVMAGQANELLQALAKLGVVARGLYGEGSAALGNIFQISNQVSLGQSEEEIVSNLEGVARQIVDRERAAREWLHREHRDQVEDRVARAYGILTNARLISSQEAMRLLSDLRLGIDLHVLGHLEPGLFHALLVEVRPGFLQKLSGGEEAPDKRDVRRAALIRQRIRESERRAGQGRAAEGA